MTDQFRDLPKMLALMNANPQCRRVTKYLAPNLTLKATYQGKRDRRNRRNTVLVTFGTPNYREAKFIKACQKAGEPFPVKKLQVYCPKQA